MSDEIEVRDDDRIYYRGHYVGTLLPTGGVAWYGDAAKALKLWPKVAEAVKEREDI